MASPNAPKAARQVRRGTRQIGCCYPAGTPRRDRFSRTRGGPRETVCDYYGRRRTCRAGVPSASLAGTWAVEMRFLGLLPEVMPVALEFEGGASADDERPFEKHLHGYNDLLPCQRETGAPIDAARGCSASPPRRTGSVERSSSHAWSARRHRRRVPQGDYALTTLTFRFFA